MADNTTKAVHSLILDSGPIIKNEPSVSTLLGQAETLFTIPAVIEEIRDAVTRARVETTLRPFLTVRQPRPASVKIITDFARRTGDLEVLSKPDIHLMALAYELECERNRGDWRLRSMPGQKRVNGAPPTSLTGESVEKVPEVEVATTKVAPEPAPAVETRGAWGTAIPAKVDQDIPVASETTEIEEKLKSTTLEPETEYKTAEEQKFVAQGPDADQVSGVEGSVTETKPEENASDVVAPEETVEEAEEELESDEEGWITPSNLKEHQAKDANGSAEPQEEPKMMQVALITTDFAMQNVLLRMNLNLLSPSLQRIRQLKSWVLRCHACFNIEKDMAKQFCGRCGKPTLLRTSCSTDKDGNFRVHLKKNMQWNTRGNVYSIPKPVHGTSNGKLVAGGGKGGWGQGLILAEDQKEYVKAMVGQKKRKDKDLMDEDYLPSILTGDRGKGGGRTKVGAGKGVNSRKRH
ncbi:hypothetical protein PVAG01_04604 [Phlyctema vagabunda]|uniref:20S-pre-rRNA D-site endonuclease NOB1 n=1 Tax=Phlyctema vagabunda TaxID=108571 RepID=A0ABR4PIP0_9HELO